MNAAALEGVLTNFLKATAKTIDQIAEAAEPEWEDDFKGAVNGLRASVGLETLALTLATGDAVKALASIEFDVFEARLTTSLETRMQEMVNQGAGHAAKDLGVASPRPKDARFGPTLEVLDGGKGKPPGDIPRTGGNPPESLRFKLRFDLVNPESTRFAREHAGELVAQVTDETKDAIKVLVEQAFTRGVPPAELAEQIKQIVGLTTRQAGFVETYRTAIGDLQTETIRSLDGTTITRKLTATDLQLMATKSDEELYYLARGLQSDEPIARMFRQDVVDNLRTRLATGKEFTDAELGKMANTYRDRLVDERAYTIARTESLNAAVKGQQNLWSQGVEQGLIIPERMEQFWTTSKDSRVCEICAPMQGRTADIGEPFDTPIGPASGPPLHPRDRCGVGLTRKKNLE